MKLKLLRKIPLVAVVALLVTVAGCTTGPGPSATPTDTRTGATATPTDTGTRATATQTDTGGQESDTATAGDIDGPALRNATAVAVADAGSYTVRINSSLDIDAPDENSLGVTTETIRVDLTSERGVRRIEQSLSSGGRTQTSTTTVYTDGNRSYRQQRTPRGVVYDSQTGSPDGYGAIQPVNVSSYSLNVTEVTASFEWDTDGTETVDDTGTVRYRSTNLTDARPLFDRENVTVVNASATLYVDDDSVVRRVSLAYTVRNTDVTSRFELTRDLTAIGSTTVEEPKWLPDARETETTA